MARKISLNKIKKSKNKLYLIWTQLWIIFLFKSITIKHRKILLKCKLRHFKLSFIKRLALQNIQYLEDIQIFNG